MSVFVRPLFAVLTILVVLLVPATGMAESMTTTGHRASASVDLQVRVPPVMQVLENSHPTQWDMAQGIWNAQQRLVVVSTMKRGFCITLRQNERQVDNWRLHTPQEGGVTLSPVTDGYRVCTARPGRYTLLLQHAFETTAGRAPERLRWPVQTDLTAL